MRNFISMFFSNELIQNKNIIFKTQKSLILESYLEHFDKNLLEELFI